MKNKLNIAQSFYFLPAYLFLSVEVLLYYLYIDRSFFLFAMIGGLILFIFLYFLNKVKRSQTQIDELESSLKYFRLKSNSLEKSNNDLCFKLEQSKKSNEQLERYAHTIAHDFQAPLRTIKSFAGLFKKKRGNYITKEEQEYLNFIIEGATNLSTLVSETLDNNKLNNTSQKYPVNLNEVLSKVEKMFQNDLKFANASIEKDKLPTIYATYSEMVQIFQNLMNNSLKFQKPDTPLQLQIKFREASNLYLFSFTDNGIGIDEEKVGKAFNFLTKSNTSEGYGIGLATCKTIIKAYNGTISMSSQLGIGTTIHFSFPKELTYPNHVPKNLTYRFSRLEDYYKSLVACKSLVSFLHPINTKYLLPSFC